jgi:DNA polymerase III delta subunit
MIYFLHGTDTDKARGKAHDMIDALQKKKPDASFFKMNNENWDPAQLEEYAGGMGLFSSKYIVFLDRLCEDKKIKEDFVDFIKNLSESENIFIILEGKLDKATIGKIEKKAEKTQEFMLPEEKKKEEYSAFGLANAVGNRDRKNAWVLYRQAIDRGEAPEALHGMMFWKVKTMLTTGFGGAYSKDELYLLADKMITVYHDSRRGVHELETGVEALILSL